MTKEKKMELALDLQEYESTISTKEIKLQREGYEILLSKAKQENDKTAIAIFKGILSLNNKDLADAIRIFEKNSAKLKESQIKSRRAFEAARRKTDAAARNI